MGWLDVPTRTGIGGIERKVGHALGTARLITVGLPAPLDPGAELDPHPFGLGVELDPLEGVRIAAVLVDAARGQLQAGALRIRGDGAEGLRLVQMAAQQEVTVQVDRLPDLAAIEFRQIAPRVVQQGDPPLGVLGLFGHDRLVELPATEQQVAVILVATGHPRRIQARDVQALAVEVEGAPPPGQRVGGVEPTRIPIQVGIVALEEHGPLVLVLQELGDGFLRLFGEQTVLDMSYASADPAALYVMVTGHKQQTIAGQRLGRIGAEHGPKLTLQPILRQAILIGLARVSQVPGDGHQVRRQPALDLAPDEARQLTQYRLGVPGLVSPEVDVREMQEADGARIVRLGHGAAFLRDQGAGSLAMACHGWQHTGHQDSVSVTASTTSSETWTSAPSRTGLPAISPTTLSCRGPGSSPVKVAFLPA